jgi:flagellin
MEKLASGFRVNKAADDAAGLAISEKMRAQIGGLATAQRNAQDGISLVQTAEGALTEVHSMLQRVRDLKVQSENGTLNADDKAAIFKEVSQLGDEISEIIKSTTFNGIKLLAQQDSTTTGSIKENEVVLQVGANENETIKVDVSNLDVATVGAITGPPAYAATTQNAVNKITAATGLVNLDVDGDGNMAETGDTIGFSIQDVDDAIKIVSERRAGLGAVQNRLEHRLNNLGAYQENLVAAESRIRDVDMASEMVNFSKLQILQQAGTAMLAQANQSSQGVLSLLR